MSSSSQNILVVGGTRGIGLSLVEHSLEDSSAKLFVTARQPGTAKDLHALAEKHKGRVEVFQLDVTSEASVESFAKELNKHVSSLHTVWINSGVKIGDATVPETTVAALEANFRSNVVGSHLVARAVAPLLSKSSSLVFMGTGLATLGKFDVMRDWMIKATRVPEPTDLAYSLSKTALSSLALFWRYHLKDQGVKVVYVHPGFVKTDLWDGKESTFDQAPMITADASGAALVKLLPTINPEKTTDGIFFWNGQVVPF